MSKLQQKKEPLELQKQTTINLLILVKCKFQNVQNAHTIRCNLFHSVPFVRDIDCAVTVRRRHLG